MAQMTGHWSSCQRVEIRGAIGSENMSPKGVLPPSQVGRGGGGESRDAFFLCMAHNGSKAVMPRGVGPSTATRVVEGLKNEHCLECCPFLSLSDTPRSVTRPTSRRRSFRPFSVHAREGECLDSFSFNVDVTATESRLASTTCSGI